jgi:hypothetical protein
MGLRYWVILSLGFSFTVIGHADVRPICERSHAYAVQLLTEGKRNVGNDPMAISEDEADRLVSSGDYARIDDEVVEAMQMGTPNAGGRFGTGLCWWHARFHRSAVYLMDFAPSQPKPDAKTARKLMARISYFLPTTVPGYRSLAAFTHDFPNELYSVLSDWEVRTTVYAPEHMIGGWLTKNLLSKRELERVFTESAWNIVDDLAAIPRPVFLMWEEKGAIHGILAVGTHPDPATNSVMLRYVDNNYPGGAIERTLLKDGVFPSDAWNFGFHQAFDHDFTEIQKGLRRVCGAHYEIPFR